MSEYCSGCSWRYKGWHKQDVLIVSNTFCALFWVLPPAHTRVLIEILLFRPKRSTFFRNSGICSMRLTWTQSFRHRRSSSSSSCTLCYCNFAAKVLPLGPTTAGIFVSLWIAHIIRHLATAVATGPQLLAVPAYCFNDARKLYTRDKLRLHCLLLPLFLRPDGGRFLLPERPLGQGQTMKQENLLGKKLWYL